MRSKLTPLFLATLFCLGNSTLLGEQAARTRGASRVPDDPFSWLLITAENKTSLGEGESRVAMTEADLLVSLPAYAQKDFLLMAGAGVRWNYFKFDNVDEDNLDLYGLTLPIDILWQRNDWSFWINATPGVFSDLEETDSDDFRTLAHALVSYRQTSSMEWALGAAYDRAFGDDELYPLGGFVWDIADTWRINAILPIPSVWYAPIDDLLFFADIRPAGDKWNFESRDGREYDFELESWRLGIGAEYRLAQHVWLHVAAGMDIDRSYKISRDDTTLIDNTADDAGFGRIGITVR